MIKLKLKCERCGLKLSYDPKKFGQTLEDTVWPDQNKIPKLCGECWIEINKIKFDKRNGLLK